MPSVENRLCRLEGLLRPVVAPSAQAAAIEALIRACDGREDRLRELLHRLDAGEATDADAAILAGMPSCDMPAVDVLRLVVDVIEEV